MTALAAALSLMVGLSLGLLGGGGSILTLPILLYVVGMPAKEAIATSLLVVGTASLLAMLAHAREHRVSFKLALWFGAASMSTAYVAGRLAHHLPGHWLLAGFTATMLVTGAAMLRPRAEQDGTQHAASTVKVLGAGAGVGALTGLVGAGGGFLIVPALTLFAGLEMPRAVGTSLLIITLNSLAGFAGYLGHVNIDLSVATLLTGTAALGSLLGSALAGRLRPAQLRRGFAGFVLIMGLLMAFKQLRPDVLDRGDHRNAHAGTAVALRQGRI
jgi:uncharacterized membrane protein YfcA